MAPPRRPSPSGFTLIEVLAVIAIIGVLIGLLLPAVQMAREAARQTACSNNLKQIGLALQNYNGNHGCLPPGYFHQPGYGWGGFGWGASILPEMEQRPIFDAFNFDLPAWSVANVTVCEDHLGFYMCPSDFTSLKGYMEREGFRYALGSYVANFGPPDLDADPDDGRGVFRRNSAITLADVTDGLSQTLFVGERHNGRYERVVGSGGHFSVETVWAGAIKEGSADDHGHTTLFQAGHRPGSAEMDDRDAASKHGRSTLFVFGDGSVHPIRIDIDLGVYRALSTRAGADVVGTDRY